MLRRPQRTEARLRAGGEDGAYLCGSLEGGGEQNNCPARSQWKPPWAEARARGVPPPLFSQPQHGERVRCGTGRARGAGVAEQELSALAERVRASPASAV